MTVALALHLLVVGFIAALAARFGDAAARRLRLPTRHVWIASLLLTLGVPLLALAAGGSGASREAPSPVDLQPAIAVPSDFAAEETHARPLIPEVVLPAWIARVDSLALALWGALALVALVRLASAHWGLRRQSSRWSPIEIAGYRARLSSGTGPAVVGVLKPSIVVPEWALESPSPVVRLMLAHEHEHVRSRDPLLLLAADIAVSLVPWHPALHWQRSRLRLAVELDCDARVLRTHRDTRRYAELLLCAARRPALVPERLSAAVALAPRPSTLERRIAAMTENRSRSPLVALAAASAAGVLALAACEAPRATAPVPEQEVPVAEIVADMQRTEADSQRVVMRVPGRAAAADTMVLVRRGVMLSDSLVLQRRGEIRDSVAVLRGRGELSADRPAVALHSADGVLVRSLDDLDGLGISPERIESVEIIKGTAATRLYGPEANGGVVSILLRDGSQLSEQPGTPQELRRVPPQAAPSTVVKGSDGSARVRSTGSSQNGPLVIVDGVVLANADGLQSLDPARIQSVEVIKGEEAVRLYGSRASNGVVVVTSKK
jgi:TonB-dependent SusC/RagA subfamily outer membrane receptor